MPEHRSIVFIYGLLFILTTLYSMSFDNLQNFKVNYLAPRPKASTARLVHVQVNSSRIFTKDTTNILSEKPM